MRVIVDANIVFSALLNTNGKIADLLIHSGKRIQFIAPEFLRLEISKHFTKLCRISGLTQSQLREAEFQIYREISFISEEQIKPSAWAYATKILADIDPNDAPYVAYAKHFRCKIWSGDKQLMKGLTKKNIALTLTTEDLLKIRNENPD